MATGGRKTQLQVVHEISQSFGPTTAASFQVGVLPAGGVAMTTHLLTAATFNSTTNTIAVGTTPGGNQFLAASSTQAAVARVDTPVPAAFMGPFPVDTPIYATLAFTGAPPTQGAAMVWIDYLPGAG